MCSTLFQDCFVFNPSCSRKENARRLSLSDVSMRENRMKTNSYYISLSARCNTNKLSPGDWFIHNNTALLDL